MFTRDPCLPHARLRADEVPSLSHPLLHRYVAFVVSRARPNTVRATVSDLRVFFAVVDKEPTEVKTTDVLGFIAQQRKPRPGRENVVRLGDREGGLSSRTIQRRLAIVSGLFGYLVMVEEMAANLVPPGLTTRRSRGRRGKVALVRSLPRSRIAHELVTTWAGQLRSPPIGVRLRTKASSSTISVQLAAVAG